MTEMKGKEEGKEFYLETSNVVQLEALWNKHNYLSGLDQSQYLEIGDPIALSQLSSE